MSVYSGWCVWLLLITLWGIIKLDIFFVLLSSILENWKIILHVLYVVVEFLYLLNKIYVENFKKMIKFSQVKKQYLFQRIFKSEKVFWLALIIHLLSCVFWIASAKQRNRYSRSSSFSEYPHVPILLLKYL